MSAEPRAPETRPPIFGRQVEVAYLLERVRRGGATFVAAPPKMGKTRLLQAVCDQLGDAADSGSTGYLLGYHESKSGEDLLRYAVQDLYTRWLDQASLREQAAKAWSDQQGRWLTRAANSVSSLFASLGPASAGVGSAIQSVIDGLIAANSQLKSSGIDAPALAYDQARDLASLVAGLAQRRVVLVFDAWEQSEDLGAAQKFLASALGHPEDWPEVHFIVGVRHPDLDGGNDVRVWSAVEALETLANGRAEVLALGPMALAAAAERARLLDYLRATVPAAAGVPDPELLRMLNAYPGTLDRWTHGRPPASAAELQVAADDAQNFRYPEFDGLLPKLDEPQMMLAVRLSLLPRMAAATWPLFRPLVEEGLAADGWMRSVEAGVLANPPPEEGDPYPTFGHDTRHGAAARWFWSASNGKYQARVRTEANRLVVALVLRFTFGSPDLSVYASAINAVQRVVTPPFLSPFPRLIGAANQAFFAGGAGRALLGCEPWPGPPELRPRLAAFFSFAAYNSVVDAAAARDAVLMLQLVALQRTFQRDFPDDAGLRLRYAMTLLNASDATGNLGLAEQTAQLVEELRRFALASSRESEVWREYGYALQNQVIIAQNAGDLDRADQLVAERRALAPTPPDRRSVRDFADTLGVAYAQGLYRKQKPERLEAWLQELLALANDHRDDPYLREQAAKALGEKAAFALDRREWDTAVTILLELVAACDAHPDEVALSERVIVTGSQICLLTPIENLLTGQRPLLEVMKKMALRFPASTVIRQVRTTLRTTLIQALQQADPVQVPDRAAALADLEVLVPAEAAR